MIAWPKRQRPLSVVLHADELTALFQTFRRLKYRALFMTCYAAEEPDDTLLLCSAGLTEMVPDDRLAYQLPQKPRDFQFFCYLSEIIQPGSLG